MAMIVKNNMSAINTLNTLNKNQLALGKSLAKVSSGQKINSAQDDASGFAISERMRVMVRALDQANQNTQNGSSMLKVAEGAVANTVEILKTLKEKAINAATDTNTDEDRATIQKEINQFVDQINDNALITFNGKYLIDGSKTAKTQNTTTATVLLNQSLMTGNILSTALTGLKDRAGNSLNIVAGDSVKVSWVIQGKTFTATSDITSITTLQNILSLASAAGTAAVVGSYDGITALSSTNVATASRALQSGMGVNAAGIVIPTPNNEAGLTITASNAGLNGQISGFTIVITDQYGNAKKSANERLEFTTAIFAANQSKDNALKIHVGSQAGQTISVGLADMRAEALGIQNSDATVISVATPDRANAAISAFDTALKKALDQATTIGAIEARLEYTASNLTTSSENVQAAESTIRDADMAKEMTNYTKNNVLLQAAQSMLAQANQNSSAVLSLLQ
jgi:flagellin